jgi:hypothetical protein
MIIANLTMIIANLALARSVNYNSKVCCKLKRTFTIVNYDPKPFIVQATGLSVCNAATGKIEFGWLWLMWHALYLIGSDHPSINNTKRTLNIWTCLFCEYQRKLLKNKGLC